MQRSLWMQCKNIKNQKRHLNRGGTPNFFDLLNNFFLILNFSCLSLRWPVRKPSTHKMSAWVRVFFIKTLPRLLLMRVPKDLLKELAASKINYGVKAANKNSSKKSKFNTAMNVQFQSGSGCSSPDSIRAMQGRAGCNGLHSTAATNRWVIIFKIILFPIKFGLFLYQI